MDTVYDNGTPKPLFVRRSKDSKRDLAHPHAVVVPVIAKKLRRIIDLGDGVKITGPAAQVDPRIEEGQDDQGWFVKVRATRRPHYGTGG